MPRILRATVGAALTLALLAPTAAYADRWSSTDAEGDVEGWTYSPEPEPCGTFSDVDGAEETHEDITRLGVRHTRRAVVVTVRFRDLQADLEHWTTVYIRGSRGGFWLDLDRYQTSNGKWHTMTFLSDAPQYPDPEDIDECGGFGFISFDIGCRIQPDIDVAADLVRLSVPRKCLKNPRWVRIGAGSARFVEPEDPEDPTFGAFSDAWDGGTVLTKWQISYGPRVHATAGAPTAAPKVRPTTTHQRERVVRHHRIFTRP
jgi:hypothetical protein